VSFTVCILGSGAALPTGKRNPTAQYIECNNRHILIDCGEGTQLQLRKFGIKLQRITHILISHLHGDHFFGLPGLISSMHLLGRTRGLTVYGPPELQQLISSFIEIGGHKLCFDVQFVKLETTSVQTIFEDRLIEIKSFALKHRIPTWGYRIEEKLKPLHLNAEAIKEAGLLLEDLPKLKAGLDVEKDGREQPAHRCLAQDRPNGQALMSGLRLFFEIGHPPHACVDHGPAAAGRWRRAFLCG